MSSPKTTTLPNGLRIVTSEEPHAKTVAVAIMVGVGSRYEDFKTDGGVAHFLEHLLFKGTTKRPSTQAIAAAVDAVGGYQNAYTDYDHTSYHIKLPARHLKLAFDIMADMVTDPLLDTAEIDRERGTIIEEIRMRRDDPSDYVNSLAPALLWPNSTLAHDLIGSEEVISSVSPETIRQFYKRWYVPNNLLVSVAGAVQHEDVVAQATQLLGKVPAAPLQPYPAVKPGIAPQRVNSIVQATNQTHLTVSARITGYSHQDHPALAVIATLLGRGMSSRLFINVRERQAVAYDISAQLQNFADTGEFVIHAGVNLDKTPAAITAIKHEIQQLLDVPISQEELEKAQEQVRGYLLMALEDNEAVAQRYGSHWLLYDRLKTPVEALKETDAVTVAEVQATAQRYLQAEDLRLGIIAPQEQIDAATAAFATL